MSIARYHNPFAVGSAAGLVLVVCGAIAERSHHEHGHRGGDGTLVRHAHVHHSAHQHAAPAAHRHPHPETAPRAPGRPEPAPSPTDDAAAGGTSRGSTPDPNRPDAPAGSAGFVPGPGTPALEPPPAFGAAPQEDGATAFVAPRSPAPPTPAFALRPARGPPR